jgi:hypothetical protein
MRKIEVSKGVTLLTGEKKKRKAKGKYWNRRPTPKTISSVTLPDGAVTTMNDTTGYIDVLPMFKSAGKEYGHWRQSKETQEFLERLSCNIRIRILDLIKAKKGGGYQRHTWVHPKVAVRIARWLSPEFEDWMDAQLLQWQGTTAGKAAELNVHSRRYLLNQNAVPKGYHSALEVLTTKFADRLYSEGYAFPEGRVPEISFGKALKAHLAAKGENFGEGGDIRMYKHVTLDGDIVDVYCYPRRLYFDMVDYLDEWVEANAPKYCAEHCPEALPALEKVLGHALPELTKVKQLAA